MLVACATAAQAMNFLNKKYPYPAPPGHPEAVEDADSEQDVMAATGLEKK